MSDGEPCGRPARSVDPVAHAPICWMHSRYNPDPPRFRAELDAILSGKSDYIRAGCIDFTRYYFPQGVGFGDRTFDQPAVFDNCTFADPVTFARATFEQRASFVGAKFGDADFSSAVFENTAIFTQSSFAGKAEFRASNFKKDISFEKALFQGPAQFIKAQLNSAVFAGSTFQYPVSFAEAQFSSAAIFSSSMFRGLADFEGAVFEAADFDQALFDGGADFEKALFRGDASLDQVQFSKFVDFESAVFWCLVSFKSGKFATANFRLTSFIHGADFSAATFTGDAEFQEASFAHIGSANDGTPLVAAIADFTNVRFEQPARVWFSQVNKFAAPLKVRFLNCDVEYVHLEDVRWNRYGGRMILQDERDIRDGSSKRQMGYQSADGARHSEYELVAITYRQLVNNFDRVRSLDLAEDCFCGAMEMNRLDPNESGVSRVMLGAYKMASSYGSSYARALIVLFSIMIFFGLVFALPSFGLAQAKNNACRVASTWSNGVPRGLFHSLEVATFQRDVVYDFIYERGRFGSILEQILISAQSALLLLALRRRFRR